jgi:hypothetical protein
LKLGQDDQRAEEMEAAVHLTHVSCQMTLHSFSASYEEAKSSEPRSIFAHGDHLWSSWPVGSIRKFSDCTYSSLNPEKGPGNASVTLCKVCVPKAVVVVLFQYEKLPRSTVNLLRVIFITFVNLVSVTYCFLLPRSSDW